ncbi:hypothetical protein PCE1_003118 [Barthelona sp. PCE]
MQSFSQLDWSNIQGPVKAGILAIADYIENLEFKFTHEIDNIHGLLNQIMEGHQALATNDALKITNVSLKNLEEKLTGYTTRAGFNSLVHSVRELESTVANKVDSTQFKTVVKQKYFDDLLEMLRNEVQSSFGGIHKALADKVNHSELDDFAKLSVVKSDYSRISDVLDQMTGEIQEAKAHISNQEARFTEFEGDLLHSLDQVVAKLEESDAKVTQTVHSLEDLRSTTAQDLEDLVAFANSQQVHSTALRKDLDALCSFSEKLMAVVNPTPSIDSPRSSLKARTHF